MKNEIYDLDAITNLCLRIDDEEGTMKMLYTITPDNELYSLLTEEYKGAIEILRNKCEDFVKAYDWYTTNRASESVHASKIFEDLE